MHRLCAMQRLLQIWPSLAAIAEALQLPYPTVASWQQRGVPPRRYASIIAAARAAGSVLTFEELAGTDSATPTPDKKDAA